MYLACVVDDSLLNDWDWFNDDVSFDGKTDAEVAPAYKTQFTWGIFYNEIMYACKAALLCFYMDLAPRLILPKEWWLIVVSWVFVIVAAINHVSIKFLLLIVLKHCAEFGYWVASCKGIF